MNNIQKEMQGIIKKELGRSIEAVKKGVSVYISTFGKDSFYKIIEDIIEDKLPMIAVVCDETYREECEEFLQNQCYKNYDFLIISYQDSLQEVKEYLGQNFIEYIYFYENGYDYDELFLYNLAKKIQNKSTDLAITLRYYVDSTGYIGGKNTQVYDYLKDGVYYGNDVIKYVYDNADNIFGSIGVALIRTATLDKAGYDGPLTDKGSVNKYYRELLQGSKVCFCDYAVRKLITYNSKEHYSINTENNRKNDSDIEKKITFFYTDKGEYYNLKPIADEAQKRGYDVAFTEDIHEKAEIGVYCQHVCYPENSKFSLVLLHDMAQGHNRWPNLWEVENWNKFDIGILPGKFWGEMWRKCSFLPYVHPRCGCYIMGYPKGDEIKNYTNSTNEQYDFKYEKTILYAPSWENDEKEDDFVRALASLPVNLLIKQAHWPKEYQFVIDNIKAMRDMHEGKYENVYYIEPEQSIMDAIKICDLIVSDESSVMTEGILLNKPSIAVYDWLIPDVYPERFASTPFDYVVKCKKVELREYVEKFLSEDSIFEQTFEKGRFFYNNIGNSSKDILDAVEYYLGWENDREFKKWELDSAWPTDYIFE